jgi:hypothetical protein
MIFRCRHSDAMRVNDANKIYLECNCGWKSSGWIIEKAKE